MPHRKKAIDGPLFPAHAGVIPNMPPTFKRPCAVPRTRGGDPTALAEEAGKRYCSPHTRG